MDGEDEKKFVCRYCNKRYRCGKSLGGHLRSHRIAGIGNVVNTPNHSAAAGESAAYVLRENPKKTRRFADSRGGGATSEHDLERFCKECGKGFQSMKALCGHMACHSDKDGRRLSTEVEVLDSQSETDKAPIEKRSKRVRYRVLDFNGSSSVSEIEQEQQEEVALCLMMLSRDCGGGFVKGLSSFAESSDNNSVVLEAKSSSIDMNKNGFGFADSGYFRNGAKSDVSVDGFGIDGRFNKLGKKNKSGLEFINEQLKQIRADQSVNYGPISRSSSKRIKDHELWEICHEKIENRTASIDESCKIARKRSEFEGFNSKINGCYDSICESGENSIEADSFAAPIHRSGNGNKVKVNKGLVIKAKKRLGTKKSKGHECPICFRIFKSGQALGGHKRSHFIGGSDGRTVVVIAKQQVSRLLDLNLPAPDEEEDTQERRRAKMKNVTSLVTWACYPKWGH